MDLARDANLEANMVVLVCFELVCNLDVNVKIFKMISRFRSPSRLVLQQARRRGESAKYVRVRPETRRKAQLAPPSRRSASAY
jgi:hypothetical protein